MNLNQEFSKEGIKIPKEYLFKNVHHPQQLENANQEKFKLLLTTVMAKINKTTGSLCWRGCGWICTVDGITDQCSHSGNQCGKFPKF